jgi:signal transduction histidine kinase
MNDAERLAGAEHDSRVVWSDLALVALVVLAAWLLFATLELNEALFAITRRWELMQVDEFPATLLVLAVGLVWFSWRRYREARAELALRRSAEAHLQTLLLENRRLAQQSLAAQESERKRLARELHDELGQYLNAIKTDAASLRQSIEDPAALRATAAISGHAEYLYAVVRNMIRELRPVALDELGLNAALEHYVEQCAQRMPEVTFEVSLAGELDSLDEQVNLAVYRLIQESLTNISRHAGARRVVLSISRASDGRGAAEAVTVKITDDGRGADLQRLPEGVGLIGMRERIEMLGGQWHVATQPGAGFAITARIPLDAVRPAVAA